MKKDIKFSLVYRDMWQSSGKYVPTVSQLKEVAPAIIDMGCFDRVETNGGAFEQVNLLFGEKAGLQDYLEVCVSASFFYLTDIFTYHVILFVLQRCHI